MILPVNLAVFYPFPKSLPVWQVAGAVLFLLLISLTTIRFLKRTPYIAVGWFWFLGTLVPVIGIVQGGLWPALADRWSYVPLIGMFIAITWGISELCGILKVNRLLLFFPATIILIVLAIMSRNQLGYWKDSFTLFDHAQKVTIDNYYAKATLAVILEKQGKEKEAEYYYNEALRLGPNFPECHLSFGVFLSKQGKQSKALYHFAEALRLLPESVDVHYNIAAVFFKQGNTAKAIEHYLNGLRLKPDSEKILINLGNVYLSLDDISTAEKYYKEALQLNPSASKAYYHLGLVAEKKGDTKAIIKNYEAALNINPDYVEAHTNLAVTLHSIGQVQNAMYHLREVLRTNPDNQSAYNNLTLLSNTPALKKIKLNIQKLKSALVKSSGNAVVFYKLGMMYSLQGDYLNALPAFQKALDLKSGFIEALDNMATLYVMTNNYDDAITKYKKMIELQPENNTIYYNMCCAYSKQGKTEKSVKYLKKAINKGFDDWEYLKNDADLEKIRDTDYYQNLIAEVHLPKK